VRAFFAIDLPKAAVDGAVSAIARLEPAFSGGVSFTPRDKLHVTLQFLGEIGDAEEARAVAVARELCRDGGLTPFRIVVAGVGAFPDSESPRVIFLGIERAEPLIALAGALGARLRAEGFTLDDRPYHPHLTLARIKARRAVRPARDALSRLVVAPHEVDVDRFALYESRAGAYQRREELLLTRE
jgi:2'-5' RNA ligase